MVEFLDAECVLADLFAKNVLARKNWKLNRVAAPSYDITLELSDAAKIIGFTVFIKGALHCIGTTALVHQSVRHGIPVGDILARCAVRLVPPP